MEEQSAMAVCEREALLRLYDTINQPVKAGPQWVTYRRATADAMLEVLKQVLSKHGVEFRPAQEQDAA